MSLSVPVMKPPSNGKTLACGTKDWCSNCNLFKAGKCAGCEANGGRERCKQSSCGGACGTCGGGGVEKVEVPAVCIKSPMLDLFQQKFAKDSYDIRPGRVINAPSKAVVTLIGGKSSAFPGDASAAYPDEIDVYAVALRHVWSATRGFYSADLKDYMGLPKSKKLILQTAMYDDVLERASNKDVHLEFASRRDIDAYEPLGYSIYGDESVQNHHYNWSRTLKCMEEGGGDFFLMAHYALFDTKPDVKRYSPLVPQLNFHVQKLSSDGVSAASDFLRAILVWHTTLPKSVSFWFNGASNPRVIGALKKVTRGRDCYFMASAPWISAHKGFEFTVDGRTKKSKAPKSELVLLAQRNFAKLVATA